MGFVIGTSIRDEPISYYILKESAAKTSTDLVELEEVLRQVPRQETCGEGRGRGTPCGVHCGRSAGRARNERDKRIINPHYYLRIVKIVYININDVIDYNVCR